MNDKHIAVNIMLEHIELFRRMCIQKMTSELPIYRGQMPILEYIVNNEGCNQIDIAQRLYITPASVALSTKRMEKSGLIVKKVDENNLRSKRLYITEMGKKAFVDTKKVFDEVDRVMFAGIGDEKLDVLTDALEIIMNNLADKNDICCGKLDFFDMVAMRNKMFNEAIEREAKHNG